MYLNSHSSVQFLVGYSMFWQECNENIGDQLKSSSAGPQLTLNRPSLFRNVVLKGGESFISTLSNFFSNSHIQVIYIAGNMVSNKFSGVIQFITRPFLTRHDVTYIHKIQPVCRDMISNAGDRCKIALIRQKVVKP